MFVTYAGHASTSSDIDDYNDYVQSQANASNAHSAIKPYSSGFRVVGSTADDDARDNAATAYTNTNKGVPIHWLNGSKVADHYEDFHDGSWDDEANPRGATATELAPTMLDLDRKPTATGLKRYLTATRRPWAAPPSLSDASLCGRAHRLRS